MLTRLGLILVLLLSGCVHDNTVPFPFMLQAPAAAPTPSDWNAALKGVVLNTGGADCLQIRRANVDDCSKEKRFNLYCIDENDPTSAFSDTTPKGCGVLYMKTLDTCGDQISAGLQLKCRLDTEVPQATPSPSPSPTARPTQTPIDTNQYCVNRDPSWCWHVDSRLVGNDCWADCRCVRRSVGPCAGVPTPKPTVKPTATPPPVFTPAPTQTPVDIIARCQAGDPQYCWDKNSIVNAFGECFSSCTCLRKPNANCRVTPTQTPRATATPGPTVTSRPTAVPTATPGVQCPAGQHAVWSCEPDATSTPVPVVTARPSPLPSTGARVIAGGWFIPECTAVDLFGARTRWYDFPYVFAAYPKGFNKHVTDFKEPCTPNAEVWNATIAIPNHWTNTDAANIEIAKPQMTATIAAIRERKQQISTMRAQGVPEAKLPKMPILWVGETSTGAWGYSQDLWQGGFYKTVNGKRTLKSGAEMSSPFPKYIEFMISEYQKEGVTEFADAPYTFFWANREFNPNLSASRVKRSDARGRDLTVPKQVRFLRADTAQQKRATVESIHPEVWPKGYKWQSNDAINVSAEGHAGLDIPDTAALKRDSTYYTYYVLSMRAHHPEVTRIIPQLSNCVYNRTADSPHWAIAAQMVGVNRAFGLQPDIQIEGCDGHANELAGKPWNTPLADCVALKAIQKAPNPIVSMWASDIKAGLALDYSGCK